MRQFSPLPPPKDMDPRVYKILENLQNYTQQIGSAIGSLGRGETPTGSTTRIIETRDGISDHGKLSGLIPILSGTTIVDRNDDHSQYLLLEGRPGGQYAYGSRLAVGGGWNPGGAFISTVDPLGGAIFLTSAPDNLATVPVGNLAVIVISATIFDAGASYSDGESTFIDNVTSTPSNTWVKLKEYSMTQGGTTSRVVAVYYSIITDTYTSNSTIRTEFNDTAFIRKAIVGYKFNIGVGSTINLISSVDSAQDDVFQPDGLTRSEVGETLYLRAITQHATSVNNEDAFTPTGNFTPFLTDWSSATNDPVDGYVGARAEFLIGNSGATSSPIIDSGITNYDFANTFLAIQLTVGTGGLLNLSSLKHGLAANILFSGSTLTANMDFFYFRNAGGTVDLSHIRGSDGAFVGPVVLSPKEELLNTNLFQNVAPAVPVRGDIMYVNTSGNWASLPIGNPGTLLYTSGGVDPAWVSKSIALSGSFLQLDAANDPMTGQLSFVGAGIDLDHIQADSGNSKKFEVTMSTITQVGSAQFYGSWIHPDPVGGEDYPDTWGATVYGARVGGTGAKMRVGRIAGIRAADLDGHFLPHHADIGSQPAIYDLGRPVTAEGVVMAWRDLYLDGDVIIGGVIQGALVGKLDVVSPVLTDDSDSGYTAGSRWLNTTTQQDYVAISVAVGAAVWEETTGAGSGVTRAYVPAGITVSIPARNQIIVSGVYEIDATGILDIEAGGKLVILQEAA